MITVKNSAEALAYREQVSAQGLCVDLDYTWRYTPAINSWLGDETIMPATVEFDFKDSAWTTYFQLRWA